MIVLKKQGCKDEVFATTSKMFEKYPKLKVHKHNLYKYFSKLKKPFVSGEFTIIKNEVKWKDR